MIDQFREIIGVGVHIIPVPSLVRAPMASSVDSDTSITIRSHKKHLVLKGVRRERPSVVEDDRLSGAPILVIHVHAIFRFDRTHIGTSLLIYVRSERKPARRSSTIAAGCSHAAKCAPFRM